MMRGKLIVIEAGDGSGKETQTKKLCQRLKEENIKITKLEFPNYQSDSSALIKMYLNGEFGTDPNQVNPYAASTFYAVDRFASYKKEWEEIYQQGGLLVADRYTTSNMVHQGAKIQNEEARERFLNWLWDLEFNKLQLPVPDCVIFLDMPPEYANKLMAQRANKFGGKEKDIHERNYDYLVSSYNNACLIADQYKWQRVSCVKDNSIRSVESIHEEIYRVTKEILNKAADTIK